MGWCHRFQFHYVTNNILLTACKFIVPEVSVINLFAIFQVFLVGLGNSSEFFGFFIKAS